MLQDDIHFQIIAGLALLEGKEEAYSLLECMDASHQNKLKAFLEPFSETTGGEKPPSINLYLKSLFAKETFSGIAEVHPAWLLEILKEESPKVIGVVLRHLPSRHVHYLLEHFPRRLVMALPKLIEAFFVPSEILHFIRRRIERRFVPMRISHQIAHFGFEHLYYLRIEELSLLIHDLGLSELALCLVKAPRKVLKIVLNRFRIPDAKEILKRIKAFQGKEIWLLKDARFSVLEQRGMDLGPKQFLKELGLLSLAKAFGPDEEELFLKLRQKMSPEDAFLFKRNLDEVEGHMSSDQADKRQEFVLDHVRKLSEIGKMDSLWGQKVPGTFLQNNEEVCNPPHTVDPPAKETAHSKEVAGTF